ncbi:flavin reductase family protein [Actinocorallia sp. A-T 12471]|nr:flavin reductase family protein [Actinocorallia sp. A-T 12471]MDX6742408.1 flavin reductase family protein [Actinocorallia sp. A-T 12471]
MNEPFDSAAFRAAMGRYGTGVVVIAATVDGAPHGMAVNSFTSVSLDPPLVAFCAAHTSSTWPALRRATGWAVSVLAADQEDVCRTFSRKGADRFAAVPWTTSPGGHPVMADALAWLDLTPHAIHPAGDHELVLGRVTALGVEREAADPLMFFRGSFRALSPTETGPPTPLTRTLDVDSPFFAVLNAHLDPH